MPRRLPILRFPTYYAHASVWSDSEKRAGNEQPQALQAVDNVEDEPKYLMHFVSGKPLYTFHYTWSSQDNKNHDVHMTNLETDKINHKFIIWK